MLVNKPLAALLSAPSPREALVGVALLLTACAPVISDPPAQVVTPTLFSYSEKFQEKLASELEAMPPACDRREPADDCSAAARAIRDYGIVREEQRALEDGGEDAD